MTAGRTPARRSRASAARIRSGVAGRSWIQTPVASWIAATTAGAADVHRQLADALRAVRRAGNGASTRIVSIRGASSDVGMR